MEEHDPGGRVRLQIPLDCSTFVMFGGDNNCYRYSLGRIWKRGAEKGCAHRYDESQHRRHVSRRSYRGESHTHGSALARWSVGWIDGLVTTFAYRATDQRELLNVDDPIGPEK